MQVALNLRHFCPTARTEQIIEVEVALAVAVAVALEVAVAVNVLIFVSAAQPHTYLKYEPAIMGQYWPDLLLRCKL